MNNSMTMKTTLPLLTALLLAPLAALHAADTATPPVGRNLPKASNAAPAPICVPDVYEAVLEVDAWEVAAMRARWPRGHFQ